MNKLTKSLLLIAGMMPGALYAQKTVTVDVKANVHSISPYIYGTNEAYEKSTATRWGGNRSTSYNWENNASNGGNDYFFISDNFFDPTGAGSNTPAYPILNAVKAADRNGQFSLVSLQAAGFVAADKNGSVSESQTAPSSRWKPISFHKSTPYSLTPNADDDTVYVDELVNYLTDKLGKPGDGGVSAYAIDNEPYLWFSTHERMHPQRTSPAELIEKTVKISSVVKEIAPGTEVFGPMFFGWTDAFRWGMENNTDWKNFRTEGDRANYDIKYNWFVDFYLDTLARYEKETGIRPVDAIAFHWYPESYGKATRKRIINVQSTDNISSADLVAEDMVEARLQAPRALWDSKYTYTGENGSLSYVCTQSAMVYKSQTGYAFIPKIKESIKNFNPNTKIAFTEFEYDAEDHWSGGLCLVDVLGVFGKEDVYLACKWDVFKAYSLSAYNLYLNYDSEGGAFGTTSVLAQQSDTVALSSFASLDDKGNLHIIVVNKTNAEQETDFSIANGLYSDGIVYGFGEGSSAIKRLANVEKIENHSFRYSIPAHYAVHFILNKIPQTALVKASVKEEAKNVITLSFTDNVSIQSEAAKDEFAVSVDGVESIVSAIAVDGNKVMLTLSAPMLNTNKDIRVSYNGTNVHGISQLPIEIFDTAYVFNELENSELFVRSVSVNTIGTEIVASLSREIGSIANKGGIQIQLGSNEVAIDSVNKSVISGYDLIIYPSKRVVRYEPTVISTTNNSEIVTIDGVALSDFSMTVLGGANYAPKVDSVILEDNYTVRLYFDSNMDPACDFTNAGFELKDEADNVIIPFTCEYKKSSQALVFKTEKAMAAGVDYTLSYIDAGKISTIHDGILDSFSKKLDNKLKDMGAVLVEVPGVIQGEQYWSCVGDPVVEDCSDASELGNGSHLGYISSGDKFSYKISVPEDKNYTITLRYASESNGEVSFVINGESYHLTVPSSRSFNKWKEVYRVVPLTKGEQEIQMEILSAGFNVNYIQITDEEKYPKSIISKAQVLGPGDNLYIYFDVNVGVMPKPEEITFICNDSIQIPINEVVLNSVAVVRCSLDTIIYKGSTLSLQFASPTFVSADGGVVSDTTVTVSNKSTQVYKAPEPQKPDAVEDLHARVTVSPVPAHVNQPIVLSSGAEVSYTLISINGNIIEQSVCNGEKTITITKEGVYSLVVSDGISSIIKKIIVE